MMKVSVNNCKAKSTEKHNDRSMYDSKWKNEFEKDNHRKNKHVDCMKCGSSFEAEKQFYELTFREILDAQNERARKNYKPELTMEEWHRRHMPQEMIIQLGSLDEPPKDDNYMVTAANMVIDELEQAGLSIISADIHFDEATPHLHVRYLGIDSKGMVNLSGCLREHGVLTPLELTCKEMGIEYDPSDAASVQQLQAARPDLFTVAGKLKVKSNTALNTLTNDIIRAKAEKLAEDMGYQIDTVRSKRRHLNISDYKQTQDRQREEQRLSNLAQEAQEARSRIQQVKEHEKALKAQEEVLEAKREALEKRSQELDSEVDQRAKALVEPLSDRLKLKYNELVKAVGPSKAHKTWDDIQYRVNQLSERGPSHDEFSR